MARSRKLAGLWITLILLGIVFPGGFYLVSIALDKGLGLPTPLPEPLSIFTGLFMLVVGLFWASWAYSYLHFVGRGSPVEAFGRALYPTERLVTSGPYAYTRNPMLLGMLFILFSIALLANSLAGLMLLPFLTLVAVGYMRRFEEPQLLDRFREEYEEYRESVPILIPTPRPYIGTA